MKGTPADTRRRVKGVMTRWPCPGTIASGRASRRSAATAHDDQRQRDFECCGDGSPDEQGRPSSGRFRSQRATAGGAAGGVAREDFAAVAATDVHVVSSASEADAEAPAMVEDGSTSALERNDVVVHAVPASVSWFKRSFTWAESLRSI